MNLLLKLCISLILYFGISVPDAIAAGCEIDMSQGADFQKPLFLKENRNFLYANEDTFIKIRQDEKVYMCCPGVECELLKCNGNSKFENSHRKIIGNINSEKCSSFFSSLTQKLDPMNLCKPMAGLVLTTYNISFNVRFSIFKPTNLPLYTVCFDKKNMLTAKSFHTLNKEQINGPRSVRWEGHWDYSKDVFKGDPNDFYNKEKQKATFNSLCPGWVTIEGKNQFSRGHLIPSADFGPLPQRRLTYNLLNAVPQWQPYNEGQWNDVEKNIRKFARRSKSLNWEIITGTYGFLKCPIKNRNIMLGNGIAIPEVLYKIVNYNIVIIISNNPMSVSNPKPLDQFLNLAKKEICKGKDHCGKMANGIKFECNKKEAEGYTHACLYKDSIFAHVSRKERPMFISVKVNYRALMISLYKSVNLRSKNM